jgi:arylformamidase
MKYIDLTMTYETGMRGVKLSPDKILKKDGWNASMLQLYSHAGTHMDAPFHFEASEKTIDIYPVSRFFCDCWLIDLPKCGPSKLIEVSDLGAVEKQIASGDGLLFRTGWSKYAKLEKYRDQMPRISLELAKWCAEKGIAMVGVEPPSVADVNNLRELTDVHICLLQADIIIIEGLCNMDEITQEKVQVVALPLKISQGDGAPCRVVAIENQ